MRLVTVLLSLCGIGYGYVPILDGRIVGGQEVDINQYPYQVSVRVFDQHVCGGAIIDATTILTAAHCVYGIDHSQYSVRVGSTKHNQGTTVRVSEVRMNLNYNPRAFNNDMAILKLAFALRFTSNVQAMPLQPAGVEVPPGTIAFVSGWGVTHEISETLPGSLRAVDVAVISNAECSLRYGGGKITFDMMCAQTIGQDSCQGDSGGPLVANGRLIGIVSWGYGCARPEYPGVYSKVSSFYSWINFNRQ